MKQKVKSIVIILHILLTIGLSISLYKIKIDYSNQFKIINDNYIRMSFDISNNKMDNLDDINTFMKAQITINEKNKEFQLLMDEFAKVQTEFVKKQGEFNHEITKTTGQIIEKLVKIR